MNPNKIFIISCIILRFLISFGRTEDGIFTDYCKSGLCEQFGGDGMHTGCKNGVLHDGKFQKPPCPENATRIEFTEKEKQTIIDIHNIQRNFVAGGGLFAEYGIRAGCRIGTAIWDKELEATAFLHISYCIFAHDKCRNTVKYPYSGQNLGTMNYKPGKIRATLEYINIIHYLWYTEYRLVTPNITDGYYHQKNVMVGHFLTQVNERNSRIGCAFAKFYMEKDKKDGVMLTCNYATVNIIRGTIYNSCKVPASKCTSGRDSKYKNLCTTKEQYNNVGRLELIPYDGDGSEKYVSGDRPEVYHLSILGSDFIAKQEAKAEAAKPSTSKPITKPTQPSKDNTAAGGVDDYADNELDVPDNGPLVPRLDLVYPSKIVYFMFLILNVI